MHLVQTQWASVSSGGVNVSFLCPAQVSNHNWQCILNNSHVDADGGRGMRRCSTGQGVYGLMPPAWNQACTTSYAYNGVHD